MQKLINPINKACLTASIDTKAYTARFGFRHYGTDMVSTERDKDGKVVDSVWGLGNGTVLATGYDTACGWVLAILYPEAYNHRTSKVESIVVRHFHLKTIYVRVNQKVTKDTKIGKYGHTGKYAGTGPHLHLEADTDTAHPLYTPTVKASDFLRGTLQKAFPYDSPQNTVRNIMDYLHYKTSAKDYQSYTTANNEYIRPEDKNIPFIVQKN